MMVPGLSASHSRGRWRTTADDVGTMRDKAAGKPQPRPGNNSEYPGNINFVCSFYTFRQVKRENAV
jgi:hypothetical protein